MVESVASRDLFCPGDVGCLKTGSVVCTFTEPTSSMVGVIEQVLDKGSIERCLCGWPTGVTNKETLTQESHYFLDGGAHQPLQL